MLACCLQGDLGLDWNQECVDAHQPSRAGSIAGHHRSEVDEGTWQAHTPAEVTAKSFSIVIAGFLEGGTNLDWKQECVVAQQSSRTGSAAGQL